MSVASSNRLKRRDRRALLLLFSLLASTPLSAQLLEWEAAIAEISPSGDSFFTEVEASPGDGGAILDGAIACGHFTGNFAMGPLTLANPSGQDGVVARFLQQNAIPFNWDIDWLAHANSINGNVSINDITPGPGGQYFVCGTFSEDVTFSGSGTFLNSPGATMGFVAWGNVVTGDFADAFITNGMAPTAIALDDTGSIYVTGPGQLARKYPPGGGAPNWNAPVPAGTGELLDIALSPDPFDPALYVLIRNNMGSPLEVAILQLDRNSGGVNWTSRVGGSGTSDDFPGGLAIGHDNHVRVAFSTQNTAIDFQSPTTNFTLPNIPPIGATHGVVLRLDQAGELVWSAPLGTAQSTASSMKPTSVAVDEAGNTYCSAGFNGPFVIESVPNNGNIDTAVLSVDATGLLFDFQRSQGPGLDSPAGVAAPVRDLVVTVGSFTDGSSVFGPVALNAPLNANETRAFISTLGPIPMQQLWILTPDSGVAGAPTVQQLINEIHNAGGQVYNIVRRGTIDLAVSAYLTNDQLTLLLIDGDVIPELDAELRLDGSSTDAGWALDHVNDATSTATAPFPYSYADTASTVNVYVIDTAVDNSSGWFDTNTNLTIESTTLVRGVADPLVSSIFQHGTEMLSLIGGPDTGVAVGTPIVMKNFDFYPNGAPSTASLLADAIYQAIDHHLDFGDCDPGVILISSSGSGSSTTVSTAIAEAITEGIPVVVSAGNANANASTYLPAADGTSSGVICVGGSTPTRAKEAGSNHTTIDLSAPGDAVRVINYTTPLTGYGSFTGTSASAALTAGVAACHLSLNPWSTPAALETAISGDTYLDGSSGLSILQLAAAGATYTQTYDDWTAYYSLSDTTHAGDDDGDGWNNLSEYFHGLKPTKADHKSTQSWISYDEVSGKYTLTFNISTALLDTTSLGTMLDGGTYEVTDSTTATGFTSAPGSLAVGSSTGKQTTLELENTVVDPKCFLQVEVTPASPSP